VGILQQQASGQTVAQIVREHLSEATLYGWKSKYAGASVAELTWLEPLKEDNLKLKQMFADLSLENQAIKEILRNSSQSCGVVPGRAGLSEQRLQPAAGVSTGGTRARQLPGDTRAQ
jgi:putative transposase